METHGYSRLQLLAKEGMNLKYHRELRHGDIASLWVTVKLEGMKNIKVGVYREHRLLEQEDSEHSKSEQEQNKRWDIILDQWTRAAMGANMLVTGT